MSEQPEDTTRDIAEDGTQTDPQSATPGGGGTRGPSLSTGGDQDVAGSAVPPYDGRQDSAPVDQQGHDAHEDGARVGGAAHPTTSDTSGGTPDVMGSGGVTPADEMPAGETPGDEPQLDEGVGPAHYGGTTRGEDQA